MGTPARVDLDSEQSQVAHAEPEARSMVIAGPGAGKTEVVIERIAHLVYEEDVDPTEILVISFSNAAIDTVRRRLLEMDEHLDDVDITTLDSLALRILSYAGEDEEVKGFDRRIRGAADILAEGPVHELRNIRHVIVDEVQDIVGDRAWLTLALISRFDDSVGFTVLGDELQGIYDFQLPESVRRMTSIELMQQLSALGAGPPIELRGRYRFKSRETSAIADLGQRLRSLTGSAQLHELDAVGTQLAHMRDVEELAEVVSVWRGSTAVLCSTNGEALEIYDTLAQAGIPVVLRPRKSEAVIDSWVGEALAEWPRATISRDEFAGLAQFAPLPEGAWRALRWSAGSRGADLRVRDVAQGILRHRVMPPVAASPLTGVVVTTIHRAKGLEFDNVVVVLPSEYRRGLLGVTDRVRRGFVALSRAKSQIAVLDRDIQFDRIQKDERSGRWLRRGHKKWQTFGFELRGSDTRSAAPPVLSEASMVTLRSVRPRDPVELVLDPSRSTLTEPYYWVLRDGVEIGQTGVELAEDFRRCFGDISKKGYWPAGLSARVERLETLAGKAGDGAPQGLWLSPRIQSLAKIRWKDTK
ncbi:MAG TPA: UvrD-helicase domain-containing protein [Actinomycetaceae bacterium]|nr:UvrD-helicase domain-containing protein [Actinomycetaceae bacterium]